MKIAIASEGKTKIDSVSDRAGRAPFYLIFEDSELLEVIDNPFSFGSGGAGFSVAKMLADKNANIVVAGKFGPKMTGALVERGLDYTTFEGSVESALASILNQ